jgi:nicotinamide-nucleotide amidase
MASAEIVAIGTEILLGDIVDTNSQALGKLLARYGIEHKRRTTVGDHLERCAAAIREAQSRADIVVTIGGLGPTSDDLTREAIGAAIDEELIVDQNALRVLKTYVAARGAPWRDTYSSQAMRPKTAVCLRNDSGTAPGIHWQNGEKHIIAMPGPRNEFAAMLTNAVEPILASLSNSTIRSRTIRIVGMPEAQLGEMFADEMESENPTVSPYAKVGEVHLRVTARAENDQAADALIEPLVGKIVSQINEHVYSTNDEDLAKVILDRLASEGESLAVAESCTGGLLGARLTSVPGSSATFAGGIISYSDRVKAGLLNVVPDDLQNFGAVSEEVARQMAMNVCEVLGSSYSLSITGIAGPAGATETKPVGLVFVGCAGPKRCVVEEHRFRGGREHIRELSVQRALALLWRQLRDR